MGMLSAVLSAALQLLVCLLLPFLFYLLFHRRKEGFLKFLGLYRPTPSSLGLAALLAAVSAPVMLWVLSRGDLGAVVTSPQTSAGQLRALGWPMERLGVLLVTAIIQTALAEEILFRGLIAKRLIQWLGFPAGNLLQALIFGGLHLVLYQAAAPGALTVGMLAALLLPSTLMGWALGYLNERLGSGSILPSWLSHALSNMISFYVMAFLWA